MLQLTVYHSDSMLDIFNRIRKIVVEEDANRVIEDIQERFDGGNKLELLGDYFQVVYVEG